MIKKLIPVLLALIGLGGGVGAGLALKPAGEVPAEGEHEAAAPASAEAKPATEQHPSPATDAAAEHAPEEPPAHGDEGTQLHDYVKLNNQFVVPVVDEGRVAAMVILALSLEVSVGGTESVFALEPKLRDVFLQVLFDHANSGGFAGDFTESTNMVILRDALREAAIKTMGSMVTDVLIIDIVRQDL